MTNYVNLAIELEALRLMGARGDKFTSYLASAWLSADSVNAARLRGAFPDLLETYVNLAKAERSIERPVLGS